MVVADQDDGLVRSSIQQSLESDIAAQQIIETGAGKKITVQSHPGRGLCVVKAQLKVGHFGQTLVGVLAFSLL